LLHNWSREDERHDQRSNTATRSVDAALDGTWHPGDRKRRPGRLNALYMTLVAVGNITDFDANQQFVHHVLTMDTTNFGQTRAPDSIPPSGGAR
jgi:hypothetical protein